MNADKLLALIDQHNGLKTAYRHLAQRYRTAVNDAARLSAEMTVEVDDLAEQIILKPIDELSAMSAEELEGAGLAPGQIRRLVAARRLAARLQAETEVQAEALKQSQTLVDRLVEYAHQRGELVNP